MKKASFENNICIVVQGPLTYINEIIHIYKPFKDNVIISTNDNSEKTLKLLNENNFKFIINEIALYSGRANFNNQVKNTFEGIEEASKLKFKYILKIRSDIFIDNLAKFINLLDKESFYFPAFHNYDGGYLCDHMMFGPIEFMLKLWNIPLSNSNLPPETQLTKRYDEIDLNYNIKFLFPLLYNHDIKAYWMKYRMFLNAYEHDKLFIYEKIKYA